MLRRRIPSVLPALALAGCIVPTRVDVVTDASPDRVVIVRTDAASDTPDATLSDSAPDSGDLDASIDATDEITLSDASDANTPDGATACTSDQLRCGETCVDPLRDPLHCGTCDMACPAGTNMVGRCIVGVCSTACAPGFDDCNGMADDGCETDTQGDVTNCGACGVTCTLDQADARCVRGACAVAMCSAGYDDCNHRPDDGCEAPLTSNTNCGACGTACAAANASATCATGVCAVGTCANAFGNCNGRVNDGCEASLHTLDNCGTCGQACAPAGATGRCDTGVCAIASCNAGRGNCNMLASDGCETMLNTVTNCGACGIDCTRPHSVSSCTASACRIDSCAEGYANCNSLSYDGCEASVLADGANCGRCGNTCGSALTCQAGVCARPAQPSCPAPTDPGCGLVTVPRGTAFTLGSSDGAPGAAPTVVSVQLGAFVIDAGEVTVGRFRRWWAIGHPVNNTVITYPGGRIDEVLTVTEPIDYVTSADCNWTVTSSGRDAQPVNCVDWATALEFCAWEGARLPTEAEWEWAARDRDVTGTVPPRTFPWGETAPTGNPGGTCTLAQFDRCAGDLGGHTRPSGTFPAAGGVVDQAGNVAEWVADVFVTYGTSCWPNGFIMDPLCIPTGTSGSVRAVRGGSWNDTSVLALHTTARVGLDRSSRVGTVGFRCARTR